MKSMRPSPLQECISRAMRTPVTELMPSLALWWEGSAEGPSAPGLENLGYSGSDPVKHQLCGNDRSCLCKCLSPSYLFT